MPNDNNIPDPKELKKCLKYLGKRYGMEFSFSTETFYNELTINSHVDKKNLRSRTVYVKVSAGGSHVVDDREIRFGYHAIPLAQTRLQKFKTIDELISECARRIKCDHTTTLCEMGLRLNLDETLREFSGFKHRCSLYNSLSPVHNVSNRAIVETGMRCLYNILTNGYHMISDPIPTFDKKRTRLIGYTMLYFPSSFPKFKTLSELAIKLDLMDLKPNTYAFKI